MKVLVVGSGGREHAICDAFARSERVTQIFCANGNAGISAVAERVDVASDDIDGLANFAREAAIDLTFVGPEGPLSLGIADVFAERGLRVVGPSRVAAQLESSKIFSKQLMARHGIPTAAFAACESVPQALAELASGRFGDADAAVVIKADGLAAGKGVVVAANRAEAENAVREMASLVGTAAAERILIEECLVGPEVSLILFASGDEYALMPAVRDHKRIFDGDRGPNTGGMGTFTDENLLSADDLRVIESTIVRPTLAACRDEGFSFTGILFIGLMMTAGGPQVLEYNVRFGDPETQSILVRLETDLADICGAMLDGGLSEMDIRWRAGNSACVVLAAENYPGKPVTGDVITGIADAEAFQGVRVYHAGTSNDLQGNVVTSGGRVLAVTATGDGLTAALDAAYAAADKINFRGKQFRRDIGR